MRFVSRFVLAAAAARASVGGRRRTATSVACSLLEAPPRRGTAALEKRAECPSTCLAGGGGAAQQSAPQCPADAVAQRIGIVSSRHRCRHRCRRAGRALRTPNFGTQKPSLQLPMRQAALRPSDHAAWAARYLLLAAWRAAALASIRMQASKRIALCNSQSKAQAVGRRTRRVRQADRRAARGSRLGITPPSPRVRGGAREEAMGVEKGR